MRYHLDDPGSTLFSKTEIRRSDGDHLFTNRVARGGRLIGPPLRVAWRVVEGTRRSQWSESQVVRAHQRWEYRPRLWLAVVRRRLRDKVQ